MSILAQNLKTIRKELGCTQSVIANILNVGFRTYVRYEAGERDAPVSILVKISKLGNISLENLLTKEVDRFDIAPTKTPASDTSVPEVKQINFRSGQAAFKKPTRQEILTVSAEERRMVSIFRKMEPDLQQKALKGMGKPIMEEMLGARTRGRKPKTGPGRPSKASAKKLSSKRARVALTKPKKKGKPGRKKLDRKLLKQKIDKLKMITRSVNKITVR